MHGSFAMELTEDWPVLAKTDQIDDEDEGLGSEDHDSDSDCDLFDDFVFRGMLIFIFLRVLSVRRVEDRLFPPTDGYPCLEGSLDLPSATFCTRRAFHRS